jgi:hypothetical protein
VVLVIGGYTACPVCPSRLLDGFRSRAGTGTTAGLAASRQAKTLEDAFIGYLEEAIAARLSPSQSTHFVSFAQSILYKGGRTERGLAAGPRERLPCSVVSDARVMRFRSVAAQTNRLGRFRAYQVVAVRP